MNKVDEQINPKDLNRYSLIPRTLIFLFRVDEVLLIKGSPQKKLWPGKYNGLGGHIEKGEDPLSAARRELLEESGLVCADLALCGTIIVDTGNNPGVAIYVFRGDYQSGNLVPSNEGTLEWVTVKSIQKVNVVEDLTTVIPRILAQEKGEQPFSAIYSFDSADSLQISFVT
jgi:8-oxo-dGTP diphosphatase